MGAIFTVQTTNPEHRNFDLTEMFALRHRVFNERLRWAVNSNDGLEQDQFDNLHPTYMIAHNRRFQVEGCWRLLPTTGSYMLRDVFTQLLRGENAPQSEQIWEISRFAVQPDRGGGGGQTQLRTMTLDILRSGYAFAIDNDIQRYVAVMGVAMERFLGRVVGVPMRRFGDGQAQYIDRLLSVACWIEVDTQLHDALYMRHHALARPAA